MTIEQSGINIMRNSRNSITPTRRSQIGRRAEAVCFINEEWEVTRDWVDAALTKSGFNKHIGLEDSF